jgi:hypothetical protein
VHGAARVALTWGGNVVDERFSLLSMAQRLAFANDDPQDFTIRLLQVSDSPVESAGSGKCFSLLLRALERQTIQTPSHGALVDRAEDGRYRAACPRRCSCCSWSWRRQCI